MQASNKQDVSSECDITFEQYRIYVDKKITNAPNYAVGVASITCSYVATKICRYSYNMSVPVLLYSYNPKNFIIEVLYML